MPSRQRVFAFVSSLWLLASLIPRADAQTPSESDAAIAATVLKLESAGAKVLYRDGKPFRVSFRDTQADGKAVLTVVELKQLLSLDLVGCRISDDDLAGLVPLTLGQIHLAGTAVTDAGMEHLAKMKSLALVNVEDTTVGDAGLRKLVTLPGLADLWLSGSQVTDEGLKQLGSAPNIWRLSVGGSGVSDESLKHLTALKKLSGLSIKSTSVSDAGLRTLSAAPILRGLTLIDSKVTQESIDQLKQTHPNLIVTLQKSPGKTPPRTKPRTTSTVPPQIEKPTQPHRAPQSKPVPVPETIPAELPATPVVSQQDAIAKLKSFGAELELRGGSVIGIEFSGDKSHLGDADFSFLPGLTSLEKLDLSQTSVTDDLLKQLGGLPRLKTVWLYRTNVTWIGITELEKQTPNLKVYATPPQGPSTPWVGWVVAAAVPIFAFTFYSFVRVFFSQFSRFAQLRTKAEGGTPLDPKTIVPDSSSRRLCSAAMGFGAFFILIGGSFLISGTAEAIKSYATVNWPQVEGEVVVSRVIRRATSGSDGHSSTAFDPIIIYRYEVDGTQHSNDQLATYRVANNTAETIDQRFPIGPATISYNPDDPADSVLLTGLASDNFIPIGLGGVAVLIGSTIFFISLAKRRQYPAAKSKSRYGFEASIE